MYAAADASGKARHLAEAEAAQAELGKALGTLASKHGLRVAYVERLTAADMLFLPGKLAELKEGHALQPALAAQLAGIRAQVGTATSTVKEKMQVIEAETVGLQTIFRVDAAKHGAAIMLVATGQLPEVRPLDDDALDAARTSGLTVDMASKANAAREDAMIRNALKAGPVAVLVCGAGHDLAAVIRRIAGAEVEYFRVTPAGLPKLGK